VPADLIVLATGYRPQEELVTKLFGDDDHQARRHDLGDSGDNQELRNMYVLTGQPGLWFNRRRIGAMPDRLKTARASDQVRSRKGCCRGLRRRRRDRRKFHPPSFRDAQSAGPEIHNHHREYWIPGSRQEARPGMTARKISGIEKMPTILGTG